VGAQEVPRRTIVGDVDFNFSNNLTEDLLQGALEGLPDD
jgi:hypothetical protein